MNEESIFLEALQQGTPADQATFLQRACAGNDALRNGVEMLLKAHAKAGQFLKRPPAEIGLTRDQATTESPGTVIGPYKLLQQIGEGGMGVVWMAEQTQPVQRKVALKVIKPGMDSRQVIARFEAERQALAMMDHVNIARVFDGGTTSEVRDQKSEVRKETAHPSPLTSDLCPLTSVGRPYFVMELVHGVPITKYCDDNHLTPRERLELFVPVCQAIQHAHQKGIIHRDIKPSNVMVTLYDGKPVPKVIDFGVAKATEQKLTERTLFTQYGTMVGTLEYMSPEQAEMIALGVDTRSDIYSLGVLLYELLTGSTPLTHKRMKEAAHAEILRMIKEEEPPKPSTRLSDSGEALASISANRQTDPAKLTKLVRGELDWIVMKCLEKDRNRRYETANGFAADVQRYLNDEPVQACPPSKWYRFSKFARRNRSGLAVAGLVLFFLVLLGSGAGWAWRDRAARAREVELEQMARAAEQASHLERAVERAELLQREGKRGEALAALERATLLAGEAEPSPPLRKRIDSLQGLLDAEGQDLDFVARFEAIRRGDQTEVDVEKNFFSVAKGYPKLREALKQYGIEVAVMAPADAVVRIQGRPPALQKLVITVLDECLQFVPSEDDVSRQWFLEVLQKADGDPWRREVRKAWRNASDLEGLVKDVDVSRHPANFLVMTIIALPIKSPGRLDLARRVQRAYPDDFWANNRLGNDLGTSGRPLEAIHYHTAALALQPRNPGSYLNRAITYENIKNLAQARADINQAIDLAPHYAVAWRIKGRLLQKMNDMDNAEAALRQALVLNPSDSYARSLLIAQLKNAGRHRDVVALDPKSVDGHIGLGHALRKQKKLEEANDCFRKAIELDERNAGARQGLGLVLREQKKLDEAVAHYKKAIEFDAKAVWAYHDLALILREQNKLEEAGDCFRKAIELDEKNASARQGLGFVLKEQKKLDEAVAHYKKAIEFDPKAVWAHHNLGDVLRDKGDVGGAIAAYQKAIELDPKNAKAHNKLAWLLATCADAKSRNPAQAVALATKAEELDPKNPDFPSTLGAAYYRSGEWKAAIVALDKSMELRKGGDSNEWFFLAISYWQLGGKDEARQWYDRAAKWMAKNAPASEELRRFRLEAQELLGIRDHTLFQGHTERVRDVAFFADGSRALSAGYDKTVRLWDMTAAKELACWKGHTARVTSVVPSPDGRRALSGSLDRTMRLWDVAAGKELLRFEHAGWVDSVAFSPDGRLALSGAGKTVYLWDLESGKELAKFEGHTDTARSVAFSPDGKRALSGSHDKTVRLWDLATGKEIRRFEGHTSLVLRIAFSPDGRQALSGGSDRTLRLWDVETGKQLGAFSGHKANIEGVAFSPGGRRGLSGGKDGTIRLWDLKDGRELHCIGTDDVLSVAFSSDGRHVLSAHMDNNVRLWALPDID